MLIEELQKQTEALAEQTRLLKEFLKRPDDRGPRVLAAIGPIISGLLIAAVGWYFTSTYNKQQIDLAQIQLVEKFNTQLLSDKPAERRMALAALMSLGNEDLAIRTAAALPPDDRASLMSDVFNVGVATDDYDVLRRTLRIVKPMQLGTDAYDRTPLHIAVDNNDPKMLSFLLQQGIKPDWIPQRHDTPLIEAATLGHAECVRILLASGANPTLLLGQERMNALHHAVDRGQVETARVLLEDKHVDVNARDANGRDALLIAVGYRGFEPSYPAADFVRLLLAHGANAKTADKIGRSALITAIEQGYDTAAVLLYDAGAPLVSGPTRMNALHEAVHFGRNSFVQHLLSKGISPNMRTPDFGLTPLHFLQGDVAVAQTLLRAGADPNATATDGSTVLVTALEERIYNGLTPAQRAEARQMEQERVLPVVNALLAAKADPNKRSQYGTLPLAVAASAQHVEVLEALVRAGARLNDRSGEREETPLIAAARSCQPANVAYLLKAGASRDLRDGGNSSAAERAEETAELYKKPEFSDPSMVENCTQVQQLLR